MTERQVLAANLSCWHSNYLAFVGIWASIGLSTMASILLYDESHRGTPMEMLLMALCMTLFGLAVSAIAFGAATRDSRSETDTRVEHKVPIMASRFFVDPVAAAPQPRVPIEVLLAQIERHVRLEQAAAESFIDFPTSESLHCRTMSPLVH